MATTTIAINIKGNTADISKKLSQVNAHLSNMGKRATGTKAKMAGLGNSFTGVMGKASALSAGFLGIAAAIRAISGTIGTIANFGFEMSKVEAISGATGETLARMTALAREMGATTMFTATEAAQGLKFLSMAGFSSQEAMKALPATLHLAQAGTIDLARAADISSNIMSAFGLEAEKTTGVVDDMVSTVNNANTNVQQLGDAMKYVGAAASAAGMDIPTVSAAIGVLSNAGMQGAMAGTGLRQVFIRLTNVTGAAEDSLKGMGLTLDQVNPQMVGLTAAITRLREAGMTGSEAITIFGARGAVAALNLAKGLPKYHELKDIMAANEGVAKKTADTMENNLMGSFKLLKSAVQEAVLEFGDKGLTGSLQNVIKTVTEVVRIFAGAGDPFSKFHDKAQLIVIQVKKIIEAGKLFFKVWAIAKIMGLLNSIGAFTKGLTVMASTIVGPVIGGIKSMVAALGLLKAAFISTGIGLAVVGIAALAMHLSGTTDNANASADAFERMAEVRAKALKEQTTFDYQKDMDAEGGGNIVGRLDTGDIKKVGDIESAADLGNQLAIAKKLRKENEELNSLAHDTVLRMNAAAKAGEKIDPDPILKIMKAAGVEGEVTIENMIKATKIIHNEMMSARHLELFLMQKSTQQAVLANVEAKKHNAAKKETLELLKSIGEENNRAVSSEDNRAGKVALIQTRKDRRDTEIANLENKGDLTSEEQKRLDTLKDQAKVLEEQLAHERGMLFAERAGSKALEEALKLRKQLVDVQAEQAAIDERAKTELIDPMAFTGKGIEFASGDNDPLDFLNQLERFKAKADEIEGVGKLRTPLIGANAFDLYGETEGFLAELKRFGEGGDFNMNDEQAAAAGELYDKVYNVFEKTQKARQQIDKETGGYINRPMGSANVDGSLVGEGELLKTLVSAFNEVETEMADLGTKTAQEFINRAFSVVRKDSKLRGSLRLLYDVDEKTKAKTPNVAGMNTFRDEVLENNKKIGEIQTDVGAKQKGIRSDLLHQQNLINIARQKELNAINKILSADNRSIDMQKRKLKLIGGKASGAQIAEIEGREKVADHMVTYETALRKKKAMQEADREGGAARPGDLTEEEIKRKLQEEKGIAANVIAQELAKKSSEAAGFGVSSLAKIGGGGGVGGGGDPMLNAAELANKLMDQAQVVRRQGLVNQDKLLAEQVKTTAAINNIGRGDPFIVIPA